MVSMKSLCSGCLILLLSFSTLWGEQRKADGVMAVVGDLMVHKPQIEGAREGKEWNFAPSFEAVAPLLSRAHLAVGNLETTLSGPEQKFTGYPCFNSPDALVGAGFDVVTTANNHSLDRRFAGVKRTIEQLDRAGLSHTGTWSNRWRRSVASLRSLGNFISSQRIFPRALGIILELHCFVDSSTIQVEPRIIPTWVQFDRVKGRRRVRVLPIISALQMAKQQGRKSVGLSASEEKQMSDGLNHLSKVFQLAVLSASQRQEPERLPHVLTLRRRSAGLHIESSKEKEYTRANDFEEE